MDPDLDAFFHVMISRVEKGFFKDTIFLEPDCSIDEEAKKFSVVIFVLKASPVLVKTIVRLINERRDEAKYLVFFCPRYTVMCKEILEEGTVLKSLNIYELPYELMPLEKDVLTLDDNESFRNLVLGYNYQPLTLVKHSLQRIEALYGKIPLKFAKGAWSCSVLDALQGKDKESKQEKTDESQYSEIDVLVLVDRTVDLFTPLLTQMTYEGVIDEFFNIKSGIIKVDEHIVDPDTKGPTGTKTMYLFSQEDIMFGETRDLHFNLMKEQFPKKFEEMKSLCEKKNAFKTVAEMTDYVKRLRSLKIPQLKNFFNLNFNLLAHLDTLVAKPGFKQVLEMEIKTITADDVSREVMQNLEMEITKCENRTQLLRVMCLLSLVNNGLSKEQYNTLTKEFVDAFGISELMRILNLDRAGILRKEKTGAAWKSLKDAFKLINEDTQITSNPNDITYTYNIYAPLSVRLVDKLIDNAWTGSEVDKIPGPKRVPKDSRMKLKKALDPSKGERRKVIMVYYVGGITYAEMSCYRLLSEQTGIQFIVATTQFLNGNKMMDAFKDELGSLLKPESLTEVL
eukprot:TRINITY_DN7048_c0_g5_i4.p1 TRINITY_DN7048_c0_g5~~TRINITY_DN7048_c0_g5_i4.p1  ORF type:complete len:567 (+),score=191.38 TRINITY_DN7048_c0_g5_i4:1105-2805(+)